MVSSSFSSSSFIGQSSPSYIPYIFPFYSSLFLPFSDHPEEHPLVGEIELEKIMHDKDEKVIDSPPFFNDFFSFQLDKRDSVPYKKLFTDIPILVSWLSAFADLLCIQVNKSMVIIDLGSFQLINQYEPVYFNDYLHYNIFKSGMTSEICKIMCTFKDSYRQFRSLLNSVLNSSLVFHLMLSSTCHPSFIL